MTKVIIKSENQEEIVISINLSPEEIEKILREVEEEKIYQKALENLFGILKTDKSIDEIREEIYEEIYGR